jgi:nucleoside-diphosphate-sugar epimerase
MNLIVFGLGFSAKAFVDFAASQFSSITATVTSQEKAAGLSRDTCHVVVFNEDYVDAKIESALAQADAVLISIGPDERGDPVLRRFARHIEQSKTIRWIGYLSTIGVYGDAQGGWVDEATLPRPSHARTNMRVKVEQEWLALGKRAAKPVQIFRLAGIYGPGRNPILNLVQRAQRIIKPGQVFNRIHVDDIAQTLLASLAKPRAGAVYNVTDNEPAPPQDVLTYAAELMGVEPPPEIPFEKAVMSEMARSFYADNKRVSNRLIREELGVTPLYPTYREGIKALAEAGEGRALLKK